MTTKKELTIYDIAKRLRISGATVSRALSNHPSISENTKKKVGKLAKELGYRKNNFASDLRKQKTHTIGIIIHELNSHFITSVLSGIEKVSVNANYDIIIGHSDESNKKEMANAHNLFHKRIDGLLVSLAYNTTDLGHYDPFIKKQIPIVFFDRVPKDPPGVKVVIDNFMAGYNATEHLIKQGCKKIMHVTGNLSKNVYSDRLDGFIKALTQYGLPFEEEQLLVTNLGEQAGIEVARQIMKMKTMPDGAFIVNDLCAAVCMQNLKDAGIKIPQDIAFVGFNNDTVSRIVEPKLTTINYVGREMGEVAATILFKQLEGSYTEDTNGTIILPSGLIIRDSSLKGNNSDLF